MPSARNCPTCGSSLPYKAPERLCPKCLLWDGLGETSVPPAMSSHVPGTRVPGWTKDGDQTEPELTITANPFRVRYFGDYESLLHEGLGGTMGFCILG
jgi:hypothetical protein